jgi:hypothetical protein
MAANTDAFVVAAFALWAGDFGYFDALMRDFAPPAKTSSDPEALERPEDVMQVTGAIRLRQLRQRRGEFRRFVLESGRQQISIVEQPAVLESAHLRATVWRIDDREFVMQAYLTDLAFEERLFAAARKMALQSADTVRDDSQLTEPDRARGHVYAPPGARWIVTGNPFMRVELTDLGLVQATALWTGDSMPESGEAITGPFHRVLHSLDDAKVLPG